MRRPLRSTGRWSRQARLLTLAAFGLLLALVAPATATLAAPSFTTVAAAPATVAAGAAFDIVVSTTSTEDIVVVVDLEVYDQAGRKVFQRGFEDQQLVARVPHRVTARWQTPAGIAPGAYALKVGIFSRGWRSLLSWNHDAGVTTIAAPGAPATPAPGGPVAARTYYAAPWGWSSAAGTLAAPFASIQAGLDRLAPGDTLVLRGGTYAPSATLTLGASGTAERPITVRAHPGETPVLDGRSWLKRILTIEQRSHVVIDGLTFVRSAGGWAQAGLALVGATDVVARNITARDHADQGIYIDPASRRVQILGCELSTSATGLTISGREVLVDGCRSYDHSRMVNDGEDCDGDGVYGEHGGQAFDVADTPGPVEIRNSQGWGNRAWSRCYGREGAFVELYRAQNVNIHHNQSRGGVVFIEAAGDTSGVRIANNEVTDEQFLATHQANGMEISENTVRNTLTGGGPGVMIWIGAGGTFGSGGTAGLQFHRNTVTSPGIIWQVQRALDGSARVDHNNYGQRRFQFGMWQGADVMTLEAWRARTGLDANSVAT